MSTRSTLLVVPTALVTALASGCAMMSALMPGATARYAVDSGGSDPRAWFGPLGSCASEQSLQAVQHPESLNVRYDDNTWIQYMASGGAMSMVIVVDGAVPEPERQGRIDTAKPTGDTLFGCAKAKGPGAIAAAPAGGGAPSAGSGVSDMKWAGTWNATLSYHVSCDFGFDNVKQGDQTHTVAIKVEGDNTSLTGRPTTPTSGWNPMTGTGDGSSLTLSGQFPFRDFDGTVCGGQDNAATISLTDILSAKEARGSFEGSGANQFGGKCKISGGSITLKR